MKLGFCLVFGVIAFTGVSQPTTPSSSDKSESLVWEPPQFWYPESHAKPSVPKEMVGRLGLANMNIVLEETPIKDVQARLGGSLGQRGDAGEFLQWVCMHGIDETGQWALWLEAGEIDGGTVGGFQWQRVNPSAKFDKRCTMLPNQEGGITLPIAVGLGTTETILLRTLGKPTTREGDNLLFAHEHDETIRGEPYTSDNTVSIFVRHGVVWAMQVWKTTVS